MIMFFWYRLKQNCIKLDSYSNAQNFVLFCFFVLFFLHSLACTFPFWGLKRLSDRLISNAITRAIPLHKLKKSSTSRAFHAHDTWFYRSSENALHCMSVYRWAVALSLNGDAAAHRSALKKCLAFEYEFSLTVIIRPILSSLNDVRKGTIWYGDKMALFVKKMSSQIYNIDWSKRRKK